MHERELDLEKGMSTPLNQVKNPNSLNTELEWLINASSFVGKEVDLEDKSFSALRQKKILELAVLADLDQGSQELTDLDKDSYELADLDQGSQELVDFNQGSYESSESKESVLAVGNMRDTSPKPKKSSQKTKKFSKVNAEIESHIKMSMKKSLKAKRNSNIIDLRGNKFS